MRSKVFAIIAGAALSASVLAVTASPVSGVVRGRPITVEVTKKVVNAPETETTFTVELTCTDEDGDAISETQSIEWRKPGESSWKLEPEIFDMTVVHDWVGDVTCVLTEPVKGGAVTTTFTCDENSQVAKCDGGATLIIDGESLAPNTVKPVGDGEEDRFLVGNIDVVNDFTPAVVTTTTTAAAVVVQPKFTG